MAKTYRLKDLVEQFGLQLHGDPDTMISGVGSLAGAVEGQISFLNGNRYRNSLKTTVASAVILSDEAKVDCPVDALISKNVYADYARIARLFDNAPASAPGIHPAASVAESARVSSSASVGANAVIEDGARVGDGAIIGSGTVIGANAVIGNQCRLAANVTICHAVIVGRRVVIHSGAVLGSDGYGLAFDQGRWVKVPQLGSVEIGDDCEIGANTTIDRGAIGNTVLEQDVRLDNQIQIAHNVFIGAHTAMAGCVAVAGSTRIGKNCQFAGDSGLAGHLEIADNVTLMARAMVTRSIAESGVYGGGIEAQPHAEWKRNLARLRKLDQLARRLIKLEKYCEDLKKP